MTEEPKKQEEDKGSKENEEEQQDQAAEENKKDLNEENSAQDYVDGHQEEPMEIEEIPEMDISIPREVKY